MWSWMYAVCMYAYRPTAPNMTCQRCVNTELLPCFPKPDNTLDDVVHILCPLCCCKNDAKHHACKQNIICYFTSPTAQRVAPTATSAPPPTQGVPAARFRPVHPVAQQHPLPLCPLHSPGAAAGPKFAAAMQPVPVQPCWQRNPVRIQAHER